MRPDVGSSPSSAKNHSPHSPQTHKKFDPKRVYSALVFIPLFYLLTRHLPPVFFFVLILTVSLLAMWEFFDLHFSGKAGPQPAIIGLVCGSLLLISLQWPTWLGLQAALLIMLAILIAYQVGLAPLSQSLVSPIPILFFGVIYIGLTFGHFLLIRKLPDGPFLIFFVLLVSWGGDAAAYFIGKSYGSRPLAPVLSPKKTIEGLLGGFGGAILIAWLSSLWFLPRFTLVDCLMLGIMLTILGTIGDLSESAFKRQTGAKDSGSLIPGHGGFLDRIDSLLLTVPTFYYYMVFIKGSVPIPSS